MARRNISLPDDLDDEARRQGINVSGLAQRAVADELDRRRRMAALDAWLDELDATQGPPSEQAKADAERWWDTPVSVMPREESAARRSPPRRRQAKAAG